MNLSILHTFMADQRRAKNIVSKQLAVPQDIPALDWAAQLAPIRRKYAERSFADVFTPHGFGLELKIGDFYIDYDYSTEGRADGFDQWRIFVYITGGKYDNNGPDKYLRDRIFDWVEELHASGRLTHPDNLYYLVEPGKQGA